MESERLAALEQRILKTTGLDTHSRFDLDSPDIHSVHETYWFHAFQCMVDHAGTKMYVRTWRPHHDLSKPPLVLIHDLGEVSDQYDEVARGLVDRDYAVYTMDLRGHGQSGGLIGHVDDFVQLARDVLQVVAWARHQCGGQTPIVIGVGFSSSVALDLLNLFDPYVRAAICISPSVGQHLILRPWKRFAINQIAKIQPLARLPRLLKPKSDIAEDELCALVHEKLAAIPFSAHMADEILRAMGRIPSRVLRLQRPTLFIHAERVAATCESQWRPLLSRHKRLHLIREVQVPGSALNPLLDSDQQVQVLNLMDSWIQQVVLGGAQENLAEKTV